MGGAGSGKDEPDDDATRVVGQPIAHGEDPYPAGMQLGRYVIVERIGRGGMGMVHRAWDSILARDVALKSLRIGSADGESDGAARMLREAQAMAQLSHPNVVPVYDVEHRGDDLFIAMELVDGCTLAEWLKATPRSWSEVVAVFVAAGRGLVAAHAAGLVHRDFKPANVMVGTDGRVRVMDFGLARAEASLQPSEANADDDVGDGDALTRTGLVMGTPAYMAPEQHGDTVAVGPAADQYAFCVALHEGLYGKRPFVARDAKSLVRAKLSGKLEPVPGHEVPERLLRIIVRGLAVDPAARWPSMTVLVERLARDRGRGRRRGAAALGLAITAVGAVALGTRPPAVEASRCEGAASDAEEVWSEGPRAAMLAAMRSTSSANAEDTFTRVAARLDGYTQAWIAAREEACRATHVEHTQTAEVLDLRMACLDRARTELGATILLLGADVDARLLQRAIRLVDELPPLSACADVALLEAKIAPPPDPVLARRVSVARERLAEARALRAAGRYREGLDLIAPLLRELEAVDYPPLAAEVYSVAGRLELGVGHFEPAARHLEQAYMLAVEVGDERLAFSAANELTFTLGDRMAHYPDAHRWSETAAALARRLGDDGRLEAWRLNNLGNLLKAEGRYEESIDAYRRAVALFEAQGEVGAHGLGQALSNLAVVLNEDGRASEAVPILERALDLDEETLGATHPEVGGTATNLGLALHSLRRFEEAIAMHERARDVFAATLGPDHPHYAATLTNIGMSLVELSRLDEAEPLLTRSLEIKEAALGPDDRGLVPQLVNLSMLHVRREAWASARASEQRAHDILLELHGPEHPFVAMTEANLGSIAAGSGEHDLAVEHYERAIDIYERTDGPEGPLVAAPLHALGHVEILRGRHAAARPVLERALKLRETHDTPVHDLELTRFELALALVELPGERASALRLARRAHEALAAAHDPEAARVAELIAAHE